MEMRRLGRSGVTVPTIGMGTWSTFNTDEDRTPIVDEALANRVFLFDTAANYGKSEATLARALTGRRDKALVCSKVWATDAVHGRRQAERSLGFFGTLDVYQVHNCVAWQEQLPMLEALKAEAKVTAIGVTRGMETPAEEVAELMRSGRIVVVTFRYSPLDTEAERLLLPLAAELDLGVFVISPLKGGILDARPTPEELEQLEVDTWVQAVLKWVRSDTRVSCVLTATRTPGRIAENARAGQPPLFDDDQRELVVRIARR